MKWSVFSPRFAFVCLLILLMPALSCRKNGSGSAGTGAQRPVSIFLTDDPSLSFDHVFIDIRKLEIKVEDSLEDQREREDESGSDQRDGQGDNSGGWMTISIRPGIYDILKFRNGLDTLLGNSSFPSLRSLHKVRLTLGPDNSVEVGGVTTPLTLDSKESIVVIKFNDDFLDDKPASISFSLDLDAGRSIRLHGSRLEFHPQLRAFRKDRSAGIEGRVLPAQALPVIMAISPTDTTTAQAGPEGEFKIEGLRSGVYNLLVRATAGNFADTTLIGVVVNGKEDVHLGVITLHP